MFRGKESSKRIELSQLVQDLLVFWAPCSSGGGGWLGVPPHAYMHAHARGKHDNFMQMAAPIGGIPGNFL